MILELMCITGMEEVLMANEGGIEDEPKSIIQAIREIVRESRISGRGRGFEWSGHGQR